MADIEEAVYAILKAASGVTALVGGSSSPRIYPNVVPQDAGLPAIAYQRISSYRKATHGAPASLARPRIQVTMLAESYSQVKGVAAAVREALDGYVGTAGGVGVQAALSEDETDEFGNSNNLHVVRQDWMIWHAE
jgi:hypothetical protein